MDSLGEVHRGMIDISVTIVDCRASNEEKDCDDYSTSESEVEEAYNSDSSWKNWVTEVLQYNLQ